MSLSGARILVVDDEPELREIVMELFNLRGALTTGAENGRLAFELLKSGVFDVVFSDVRMPGGDGAELLASIQKNLNYSPKVFLCTGYADLTVDEAKQLGALEVFSKPFEMKKILPLVEASLVPH